MTTELSENNQSTDIDDVIIYLLKGSIAGLLLSATFYLQPLFTELGNESKAKAVVSQAQVKVDHYKALKKLANDASKPELLKDFNEKHELNYKLAVNEVKIANDAVKQASENMGLVGKISKFILTWSGMAFVLSSLAWLCRSPYLSKKPTEFTLKNNDVTLVKEMLEKEINSVKSNKHTNNNEVKLHVDLLERMPPKK